MERLFKYSIIAGAVIAALFVIILCVHLGLESFLDMVGQYVGQDESKSIIFMVLNVISHVISCALLLVFFVLLISCHQGTSKFLIPSWMVISACGILIITSLLSNLAPIIMVKIIEAGARLYYSFLIYFCKLLIAAAFIWISICFKGIQAHKIAGLAVSGILIINLLYYLAWGVLPAEIFRDIYEFDLELLFKIGFNLYGIIDLLALASYSVFFLSFGLTKAAGFDAVIKPDDSTVKS